MKDRLGREIECLRISVTQNCNLRCIYSRLENNNTGDASICNYRYSCPITLTAVEFNIIVKVFAALGIKKVRITGGEPLTRPDIRSIIERIASIPGIEDLSMTTNGVYIGDMAAMLKEAGLKRLNISLDTLKADRFYNITGGSLDRVLQGIKKSLDIGLSPIKINTVLIKGINDDEVDDFISLTKDNPIDVRFIELMPVDKFGEKNLNKIVDNYDIISSHPELSLCDDRTESLPARFYFIEGYKGRVGFISPVCHKFCASCNRIKLSCDGKIKPCLGNNGEVDILNVLRKTPYKFILFKIPFDFQVLLFGYFAFCISFLQDFQRLIRCKSATYIVVNNLAGCAGSCRLKQVYQ